HVELSVLGTFGTEKQDLILNYQGTEVGRLPMSFLHDGIPMPTREAVWTTPKPVPASETQPRPSTGEALLKLLAHPNIASKHWIVRQYDHEVQGNLVTKPLVGPQGRGPGDASIIEPVPGSGQGLAVGCGLATGLEADPYQMALAAIDECVRNLVCVGADPDRIAILDNFCWPSCKKPENLASLVRAAEGCYDGAKAYRTPFVSGKDSLNNQFTTEDGMTIEIPPTLLITGIASVADINRSITMDAKKPGNKLFMLFPEDFGRPTNRESLAGSHFERVFGLTGVERKDPPTVPLNSTTMTARLVAECIKRGYIASAHDSSDGGPLVAVAEMLIAASTPNKPIGADVLLGGHLAESAFVGFSEAPGCYILEINADRYEEFVEFIHTGRPPEMESNSVEIGCLDDSGALSIAHADPNFGAAESVPVEDLAAAWRAPLDW
ncbi:MAG: AIR synthase related protein, partial [Planctomycetota bacterium]